MRRFSRAVLLASLCAGFAYGQLVPASSKQEHVKVYSKVSGVTLPQLLPLNLPIPTGIKCKEKIDGKVELSLLVDTEGRARNIMFVRPLGTDADRFALQIAGADRFTPGSFNGLPVVVATDIWLKIQSCLVESKDSNGKKSYSERLRSNPDQELVPSTDAPNDAVLTTGTFTWDDNDGESQRMKELESKKSPPAGAPAHAPVPLIQPEAVYTEEARKARINGKCQISLIVDPQGMPRYMHVHKSLDTGLDQNAIIAVSKYRFKPAMRDGEPIPVFVTIEVSYKIW